MRVKIKSKYPTRFARNYSGLIRRHVAKMGKEVRKDNLTDLLLYVSDGSTFETDLAKLASRLVDSKSTAINSLATSYPSLGLGVDFFLVDSVAVNAVSSWIATNVKLIKSVQADFIKEVGQLINQSIMTGESSQTLAKKIQSVTGQTFKRAKLIARNEISNINQALDMSQAKALKVGSFKWRTSLDERVRGNKSGLYPKAVPSHFNREGKVYSLDVGAGGSEPFPASGIQCRCTMELLVVIP